MLKLTFVFLAILPTLIANATLPEVEHPILKASEASSKIRSISERNDLELDRIRAVWTEKCGKQASDKICTIDECDLSPNQCRPDRVLLFRGEDHLYEQTGSSALARAKLNGSDYGNTQSSESLMASFSRDLSVLKTFEYAPQAEEVLLIINSKTGERQWRWKSSLDLVSSYAGPKKIRSSALTAYSFHVEASFPYYRDDNLKKTLGIDPLISVTSNPGVAISFGNPEEKDADEGRVIVFSVPKSALAPLCGKAARLTPARVLDPRNCTDPLNEHIDEQELDIVLYADSDWVYRSFIIR
jgi:hypothetical protein